MFTEVGFYCLPFMNMLYMVGNLLMFPIISESGLCCGCWWCGGGGGTLSRGFGRECGRSRKSEVCGLDVVGGW